MFYSTIYYLSLTDWINKIMSGKILINSLGKVIYKDGKPIVISVDTTTFNTLTIESSATTWDLSTGLKKKLSASTDFTLNITNPSNGQCGILTINATADLTITLNTGAVYTLFEGSLELTEGIYVLALIYNGDFIAANILKYPEL